MRWTFAEEIGQGMHTMMSHIGMEHDPNHGQHEQDHHYNGNDWVQIGYPPSHQTSPINEYQNYQYMPAPHSLPLQPTYPSRMLPPSTHSQPQLLPLIMPSQPTWPSMLTNPVGYMAPPVAIPHSAPPTNAPKLPKLPKIHAPSPRKTLTDNDRRRMCQYHEEHPTVKQTEIGAMFGVERSTVSKVLRQKEKYLFPEDRSASPVKKSKGKIVDIDRALSSWARKQQDQGLPLTDAAIREKARVWASTVGKSESSAKATSSSWLEKFKQKNNIGKNGKLVRRASEATISDATYSHENSAAQTPSGYSPPSPSESPLSGPRVEEAEGEDYMSVSYRQPRSQSSTSLSSNYTDGGPSPGAPFNFSPETTQGPFQNSRFAQLPPPSGSNGLYQPRPRSQTFPMLNIDPNFNQNPDNVTPKFQGPNSGSSMESPNDMPSAYSIDSQISSPTLHHRSSNGSMPPLSSTASTGSSILLPHGSSPTSPTQEEARRGLETFLKYMKSPNARLGGIDESDYMTVMKLSETLRNQTLNSSGQLHRIQEQESEGTAMKVENRMSVGA